MSYVLKERLAAAGSFGSTRTASQIKYLVLHYTGNDGDSAAGNAACFQNNVVQASAHYFVDDTTVCRSVPDLRIAWAVGGNRYPNAEHEGGGTMYGIITNTNSISVELCDTLRDGSYRATEATLENAAVLCNTLMAAYHIPLSHVYRDFDVTGKHCPSYTALFDTMMENWLAKRAQSAPSDSSLDARKWAEQSEILGGFADGSMQYKSFCTREQVAILLHRFWKMLQS